MRNLTGNLRKNIYCSRLAIIQYKLLGIRYILGDIVLKACWGININRASKEYIVLLCIDGRGRENEEQLTKKTSQSIFSKGKWIQQKKAYFENKKKIKYTIFQQRQYILFNIIQREVNLRNKNLFVEADLIDSGIGKLKTAHVFDTIIQINHNISFLLLIFVTNLEHCNYNTRYDFLILFYRFFITNHLRLQFTIYTFIYGIRKVNILSKVEQTE
eukprot:TRINITY_DN6155_c0_g1_i3.p3 TRINITY_DN6155_c0_g1~~TRINITY_DN6155_c0_g1_i3.p3  ORF type:complete len:215 (-),score=-4.10 TRINITY_DN6155_c0_g1_i3:719-1363(-)